MKNVLFLLGAYEPAPSANGICALMIINKLKSQGINVSCVANMCNNGRKEETIDDVAIRRVNNQIYLQLKEKSKLEKSAVKRKIFATASVCADVMRLIMYRNQFPVMSPRRVLAYYDEAEKIIEKKGIDTIIAINIPIETLEATIQLKKKHAEIFCVAYLLDPIYGGIHHKFLNDKEEKERAIKYEQKVLRSFDKVIVQIEHQKHFMTSYSSQELRKVDCLGVPLLSDKISKISKTSDTITAVFAGGVSEKNRNPKYIIEVFKRIRDAKLKMFLTNEHDFVNAYAQGNDNIEIHGRISHEELEEELASADCLVSIGNSQAMQAPSKLIEYMSYGKPIVTTYRIENDTSKEYMDRYPLSVYLNENDADYSKAAEAIVALVRNKKHNVSYDELVRTFWLYTSDAFLDSIKS